MPRTSTSSFPAAPPGPRTCTASWRSGGGWSASCGWVEVHEILVDGHPWDATACLWFTDWLAGTDGQEVYENRGTIVAKIAWGKVRYYEVHEDTQKVEELDEWLRSHAAGEA